MLLQYDKIFTRKHRSINNSDRNVFIKTHQDSMLDHVVFSISPFYPAPAEIKMSRCNIILFFCIIHKLLTETFLVLEFLCG